MMRNSIEHSKNNDVWICAQHYNFYQCTEIAILDEGIGILDSLKSNPYFDYISSDLDAINKAVFPGISESYKRKKSINSGYGLYAAKELCIRLGGSFLIVSGDKAVLFKDGEECVMDTSFRGTAIRIYIPNNNISDFRKLLNEIIIDGERLASESDNSIKNASKMSRMISFKD
jgi:hypothetical protein